MGKEAEANQNLPWAHEGPVYIHVLMTKLLPRSLPIGFLMDKPAHALMSLPRYLFVAFTQCGAC